MSRRGFVVLLVPALAVAAAGPLPAQTPPAEGGRSGPAKLADIDPRGRPEQDLVKVDNARYYVWYEGDVWHLRTAARRFVKFTGTIRLAGGTFGRLRPIGLERKGRSPDKWAVNAERTEIRFEIHTGGSFDGFDFDVRGAGEGRIEYDLKIGAGSRSMPRRIYIGPAAGHPGGSAFALPAKPAAPQEKSP